MKFENNLKKLREKYHLTQEELASIIGVSKSTISGYEQGRRKPQKFEIYKKLANVFNVTVDELTGGEYIILNRDNLVSETKYYNNYNNYNNYNDYNGCGYDDSDDSEDDFNENERQEHFKLFYDGQKYHEFDDNTYSNNLTYVNNKFEEFKKLYEPKHDYETLFCDCGCGDGIVLKADRFIDSKNNDANGLFISMVSDASYQYSRNRRISFKEKLKRIWYVIRDKEYSYFEIYVKDKDLVEFKKFVSKL